MKKIILSAVIVTIGLSMGCRLSCAPYDCCGPIYSNPHNCDPTYRSGSAFNADSQAPVATESAAPTTPAAAPAAAPTTSAAPAAPASSANAN